MTFAENITAERQRKYAELVHENVITNVSMLVHHFSQTPRLLEGSDYSYEDDLLPILQKEYWPWDELDEDFPEGFENWFDHEKSDWAWENGIEPQQHEALEHWVVSSWLAERLSSKGEMIGELFNLTLWGRATSGQAISMDGVIQEIYQEWMSELER